MVQGRKNFDGSYVLKLMAESMNGVSNITVKHSYSSDYAIWREIYDKQKTHIFRNMVIVFLVIYGPILAFVISLNLIYDWVEMHEAIWDLLSFVTVSSLFIIMCLPIFKTKEEMAWLEFLKLKQYFLDQKLTSMFTITTTFRYALSYINTYHSTTPHYYYYHEEDQTIKERAKNKQFLKIQTFEILKYEFYLKEKNQLPYDTTLTFRKITPYVFLSVAMLELFNLIGINTSFYNKLALSPLLYTFISNSYLQLQMRLIPIHDVEKLNDFHGKTKVLNRPLF